MADQWMIRGPEFVNCNCAWGCPCQFGALSTYGHCEAVSGGIIEEGNFNGTRLDGLTWAMLLQWPGEIRDGNGAQQAIIDERADPEQREAIRKILHGEATDPGATMFFVYNSTMASVHPTLYAPIDIRIDVDGRTATLKIDGVVEATGSPIVSEFTGQQVDREIHFGTGFEFRSAEVGSGSAKAHGPIALEFTNTNALFGELHLTQAGVVR